MKLARQDGLPFVAVAYGGAAELMNFEKADAWWIYCLEGGKVKKKQLMSLYPKDFEERIDSFAHSVLDAVICRNYGPKAMAKLKALGLELYTYSGGIDAAIKAYLKKELTKL